MKQTIRKLDSALVHALTVVTAGVSILVYGQTLLRGSDGILDHLRPVFGIPFALAVGLLLLATLAVNQRWKCIIVILLGETIHGLLLGSPFRSGPISWNEYVMSSVTIACLLASACLHFQLVDEKPN